MRVAALALVWYRLLARHSKHSKAAARGLLDRILNIHGSFHSAEQPAELWAEEKESLRAAKLDCAFSRTIETERRNSAVGARGRT